jgi:hypothetical protein
MKAGRGNAQECHFNKIHCHKTDAGNAHLLTKHVLKKSAHGNAQDMFIFKVEGTGVLKVEHVIMEALKKLEQKLFALQLALPQPQEADAA